MRTQQTDIPLPRLKHLRRYLLCKHEIASFVFSEGGRHCNHCWIVLEGQVTYWPAMCPKEMQDYRCSHAPGECGWDE